MNLQTKYNIGDKVEYPLSVDEGSVLSIGIIKGISIRINESEIAIVYLIDDSGYYHHAYGVIPIFEHRITQLKGV